MKFELLKQSHIKRNIIIGVVAILIISAGILQFTRAKYRVAESIPLVNGTINYSLADLNIVALYIDGVEAPELDGSKKYTLDTTQSTCTYKDGTTIDNLTLNYNSDTKAFSISPYTAKGTKCYLYFDEITSVKEIILANYPTVLTRNDFSTVVTAITTGTIYKSSDSSQYDDDGEVYYFAGAPTDNWVRWADFYWRIIRINGDGTIRIIYNGTSTSATGSTTQLSNTSAFNNMRTDNMYVGFKYTSGIVHGYGTNSIILTALNSWYASNLASYTNDIDTNAGFCNDRHPSTSNSSSNGSGGTGTTTTYYGAYNRLVTNKTPSFKCTNSSDLFTASGSSKGNKSLTYPIGLITADEVTYAGTAGAAWTNNTSYYLYTGQHYWTMSPIYFDSDDRAALFRVDSTSGYLFTTWADNSIGVRPVINLKADVKILSGDGTAEHPFAIG